MSHSSSHAENAACSYELDLRTAVVSRHYFPSQAPPEPHSSDQTSSGVTPPQWQPINFQPERYLQNQPVDKEWVHTGFAAFSVVSTVQSSVSSPLGNLHHRTATHFLSQEPEFIKFPVRGTFPSSVPPGMNSRLSKGSKEYNLEPGKLGGVMEQVRKLARFFQISSSNLEISDDLYSHSSTRSFSNSSISSLGSSHSFDDSSVFRLADIFKPLDSGRLNAPYAKEASSQYLHLSFNESQKQSGYTKWNRHLMVLRMHQDRRRIRQLVFVAASFIISVLFLCGIILVNLERQWSWTNVSNEALDWHSPFIDAPDRDSLIIYRIIGNDLPPRHSPTQTLTNLKFMLEHEKNFEDIPSFVDANFNADSNGVLSSSKLRVKKFFVLNRIVNQTQLSLVENLLKANGVKDDQILINAFDAETYRAQPLNMPPDLGGKDVLYPTWGIDRKSSQSIAQGPSEGFNDSNKNRGPDRWKALEFTYHFKNLYAMNNNGGRNFALEHGRSIPEARWILPLDGNCFFTPAALNSLVLSLRESDLKPNPRSHVVIPMSRLTDNEQAIVQNVPIDLNKFEHDADRLREALGPKITDEPQVGFRFTSKEIYSPEMRYGRRSKLEFLWRLGAIDRSRSLDQKTNDWEVLEQSIITAESYGSIKRGLTTPSSGHPQIVGSFHSTTDNLKETPDFIRAGWVLRLFSGDQSQEHHSEKARSTRCVNRVKGIISFLEGIDESIARGSPGCRSNHSSSAHCGFSARRLWSLDGEVLTKMKLQHNNKDIQTIHLVQRLVKISERHVIDAASILSDGPDNSVKSVDLSEISRTVFLLALTAYLTDNEKYADTAASLVNRMFLEPRYFLSTPDAFQVTLNTHLRAVRHQTDYDGWGYAFPISRHKESLPNWMKYTAMDHLPFNPYTFDPTLLLDGIRLLRNDWQAFDDNSQSEWLQTSVKTKIPKQMIKDIFTLQSSHLLLNDSFVQDLFTQGGDEMTGLDYATKLSAVASFTDDMQLLNRILTRTPIGTSLLPKSNIHSLEQSRSVHLHQRFRAGFHNAQILASNGSLEDGFGTLRAMVNLHL